MNTFKSKRRPKLEKLIRKFIILINLIIVMGNLTNKFSFKEKETDLS